MLNAIDKINERIGKIVSFIVWIGALILFIEVISRYVFQSPTTWAHGYTQRFFGSYFILIGAFTLLNKGHVRIDAIVIRFSYRWQKVAEILNIGMLLIWCSALLLEGWKFFIYSWDLKEVDDMVLGHPVYPVKFILFVGVVLMTLQGLAFLIRNIGELIKGEAK